MPCLNEIETVAKCVTKARQCLADPVVLKSIADVYADGANNRGVQGTPTFFINGEKLDAAAWSQVEPALQAAGAR